MASRTLESNSDHGARAGVPYWDPNNPTWEERNSTLELKVKDAPPRLGPSSFPVELPSYQAQREEEPPTTPARREEPASPSPAGAGVDASYDGVASPNSYFKWISSFWTRSYAAAPPIQHPIPGLHPPPVDVYNDSLSLEEHKDKDGLVTYAHLDGTNKDTPAEEHLRLKQTYEAHAQSVQVQANNSMLWVNQITEELRKRPKSEAGVSAAADAAPAPNWSVPQRLASPCQLGEEETSSMPSKSEPAKVTFVASGAFSFPLSEKEKELLESRSYRLYGDSAREKRPRGESPAEQGGLGGPTGNASAEADAASASSQLAPLPAAPAGGEAPAPAEPADDEAGSFSCTFLAAKFRGTDTNIVSSKFGIAINGDTIPFLVQITATKVSDEKGGHTFRKANGRGTLQVTSKVRPERLAGGEPLSLTFIVGSLPQRGPVQHNFAASTTFSLPGELDFLGAQDANSNVRVTVRVAGHQVVYPYAA